LPPKSPSSPRSQLRAEIASILASGLVRLLAQATPPEKKPAEDSENGPKLALSKSQKRRSL
jgi:hypothetical protein